MALIVSQIYSNLKSFDKNIASYFNMAIIILEVFLMASNLLGIIEGGLLNGIRGVFRLSSIS